MSQPLNLSVLLCHSLKIHSDTEHSINWQPWRKSITVHEQMRDQGSVYKLWCMVVLNAPLAFSLLRLLPSRGNCLSFFFINQKMKVNLTIPPLLIFFFISFMPRNVWWTSFAYVKLQRSISLSAPWNFVPDALWWVCMFLDFVCVCFYECVCVPLPNYACESIFLPLEFVFLCVFFRCMSCVASSWGCQWNTRDHTCSDMDDSVEGTNIIKQRQVSRVKG